MSKRKVSLVWEFFKVNELDSTKAICNLCSEIVARGGKTKKTFNTVNLHNHLTKNHTKEYSTCVEENNAKRISTESTESTSTGSSKQPTLLEILNCKQPFPQDHSKAKNITKLILEMIAVDLQPFSIVNDVGFQRLLTCLEPRYKIPCDRMFREQILNNIYDKVKTKISSLLLTSTSVSCTMDIWTSKSLDAYLCISAHWINNEFERKMIYLGVFEFNSAHTGAEIANKLTAVLEEWKILQMVHIVVRDNASNMISALRIANISGLSCAIHSLQLVVKSGLLSQRSIIDAVSLARRNVTHFKHSVLAMTHLHERQIQLGLPLHVLIQDEPTRWDSTFDMITRLLEQKSAVIAVMAEKNPDLLLKPHQWQLLSAMREVLQIFKEATLLLSLHSSSISMVIPLYNTIRRQLQLCETEYGVGTMKSELFQKLESCHINNCEMDFNYSIATLLDPRYKTSAFENKSACKLSENELMQQVKQQILSSHTVKHVSEFSNNQIERECTASTSDRKGNEEIVFDMLTKFLSRQEQQQPTTSFEDMQDCQVLADTDALLNASEIVTHYLSLPNKPVNSNPLMFWREYPNVHLKIVAMRYLAPPPGSVDSERAFSTTGLMTKGCRNRLKPATLNRLFFLSKALPLLNFEY